MEWEMVVAIAVATPIILLPVAFVWYLNLAGLYAAVTEARKARKGAKATA
jgi:hypothetical protein